MKYIEGCFEKILEGIGKIKGVQLITDWRERGSPKDTLCRINTPSKYVAIHIINSLRYTAS